MSAYIVSRGHIAYLVQAGRDWSRARTPMRWSMGGGHCTFGFEGSESGADPEQQRNPTEVGQMLWDENIRSVQERYPDTRTSLANAPGPCGETFRYEHLSVRPSPIDPIQVIVACQCFAYQSCETEDWERSEAFYYIQALRECALSQLPGYEDAKWGAPEAWTDSYRLPVTTA